MLVGLTYNLRSDPPPAGVTPDYYAEFDTEESIHYLATAIASLGHRVRKIGHVHKLVRFLADGGSVDMVFNMAEGHGGRSREAQVPALLEAYRIPYTGSDPLTLALCLDKDLVKRIWQHAGVRTPEYFVVSDEAELARRSGRRLGFPLFVKPVHEGSSKGIGAESVVGSEAELAARAAWVLHTYRQPILVERFLPGREFSVGVLGTGPAAQALGAVEIVEGSPHGISGFAEKQQSPVPEGTYRPVAPGPLLDELADLALRAYRAVGCRDLGRVDLRLDQDGRPQVLELNPIVGLHPTECLMPFIATQAGLTFEALIGEILAHAMRRWGLHQPCEGCESTRPNLRKA